MVMGGDSCLESCGFKSRHRILDGHFFTYICCKNCNDVCLKEPKINYKRGPGWPIFKRNEKTKIVQSDRLLLNFLMTC